MKIGTLNRAKKLHSDIGDKKKEIELLKGLKENYETAKKDPKSILKPFIGFIGNRAHIDPEFFENMLDKAIEKAESQLERLETKFDEL